MPEISVVTTLYRSEAFLVEFYHRATAAVRSLTGSYEIIFVNDGSPDRSLAIAMELAKKDPNVRVVELSRNFGHHVAAFAAVEASKGDRVFLIDSDLEESPEWLVEFSKIMDKRNCDVVYGVQSGARSRLSGLFYRVFNAVSEVWIPPHACTVRLMRRCYVDALTQLHDRRLFMAGMFMWAGFHQIGVPVKKAERRSGKSTYTHVRQFALFADAITSFSSKPLYAAFFAGSALAASAGILGIALVVRKLLAPDAVAAGFTSVIASIVFMGGLNLLFLGVIGIYLGKIFAEVKDRPLYVARPVEDFDIKISEGSNDRNPEVRRIRSGLHADVQVCARQ